MKELYIKGEKNNFYIPTVTFSPDTGICELAGESYLENTFEFYQPLIDWLKEYTSSIQKPITFNFKLTYFNTASSRSILDLLNVLKEYEQSGESVQINWYVQEWDSDMKQEIEDFATDADLPIQMIDVQQM